MENVHKYVNPKQKKAGVALKISDKIDFESRKKNEQKEVHQLMIKDTIFWNSEIFNIYSFHSII